MLNSNVACNAPTRTPLVVEALGNLNSQLCGLEKSMGELFAKLIPIRSQKIEECRKELVDPKTGVQVVDEINVHIKRVFQFTESVNCLIRELEI